VPDRAIVEDGARDRKRLLGVIGGLADTPLMLPVADISRDDGTRQSFEPTNAVRVPSDNVGSGQRFGLLADRVAGGNTFQAGDDPFLDSWHGKLDVQ
jgi:hypothetical protein